jgi:hypothetical protein
MLLNHNDSRLARLTAALLAVFCLSSAKATLASSRYPSAPRENWFHEPIKESALRCFKGSAPAFVKESPAPNPKQEFHITEQTEIRMDGRPCQYKEVPIDAVIIFLEVDSEQNKAILKIHFRSKK